MPQINITFRDKSKVSIPSTQQVADLLIKLDAPIGIGANTMYAGQFINIDGVLVNKQEVQFIEFK